MLNGVPSSELLSGSIYPLGGNKSVEISIVAGSQAAAGPVSLCAIIRA
jgi:hypothetical protein